jgi:hypothetical protein
MTLLNFETDVALTAYRLVDKSRIQVTLQHSIWKFKMVKTNVFHQGSQANYKLGLLLKGERYGDKEIKYS